MIIDSRVVASILNESGTFKGRFVSDKDRLIHIDDETQIPFEVTRPNDWLRDCIPDLRKNRRNSR